MTRRTNRQFALYGVLFAVPFFLANLAISLRIEPLYTGLGSLGFLAEDPMPHVVTLLLLGLFGSFVAAWPVARDRKFYILNIVLAVVLFAFFTFLGYGIGVDIYHCDILRIPHCD